MTVVVIGAGFAGLTAAFDLMQSGHDVVVLEGSGRVGGKAFTSSIGPLSIDEGADAFLARVPWARELCDELGLAGELTSPAIGAAYVFARGALRRLPPTNLLGVPLDLDDLRASGLVSPEAVERAADDLARLYDTAPDGDESIGSLITRRLGREVADNVVDPLLGGIYAGDIDHLSLQATAPQFAEAARRSPSLIAALRETRAQAVSEGPVFYSHPKGMGHIPMVLAERLGDRVRLDTPVIALLRDEPGWIVSTPQGSVTASHVIVATPLPVTAALLAVSAPEAARLARSIDYAGVTLATMVFDRDTIDHPLDASGFLVAKGEREFITAASWSSSKWAHLDDGRHVAFRVSSGNVHDDRSLFMPDDAIIEAMLVDLRRMMGRLGEPLATRISHWPSSFPQYRPGHRERIADLIAAAEREAPGVVLAGAALAGIGIPATIKSGRDAAARVKNM